MLQGHTASMLDETYMQRVYMETPQPDKTESTLQKEILEFFSTSIYRKSSSLFSIFQLNSQSQ